MIIIFYKKFPPLRCSSSSTLCDDVLSISTRRIPRSRGSRLASTRRQRQRGGRSWSRRRRGETCDGKRRSSGESSCTQVYGNFFIHIIFSLSLQHTSADLLFTLLWQTSKAALLTLALAGCATTVVGLGTSRGTARSRAENARIPATSTATAHCARRTSSRPRRR